MDESQSTIPACSILRKQPVFNREQETVATVLSFLPCEPTAPSPFAALEHGLRLIGETAGEPLFGTLPTVVRLSAQWLESLPDLTWPLTSRLLLIDLSEPSPPAWRDRLEALTRQGFDYALAQGTAAGGAALRPRFWIVSGDASPSGAEPPAAPAALWKTGIDNRDAFQRATENPAVTWFSGAFWKRPAFPAQRSLPASQVGSLRLLARLHNPDVTVNEVEQIISCDATLTYKLLRLLNSAFFCAPSRVESIHHGVNFFGLQRIKNWATVIVMNAVDFRPREILPLGAYRARLAENLARALKRPNAPQYYLMGLFSVLDALFDCKLEQLIGPLNLHDEIAHALIGRDGPLGEVLNWVTGVEDGQPIWTADLLALRERDPIRMQLEAQAWTNEFCRCLRGS